MTVWPFPAPEDDGGAAHLSIGQMVPRVPLQATDGSAIVLSEFKGRSVVFVYPWTGRSGVSNPPRWDDIPGAHGSTPEAEGFRDRFDDYFALGVAVFGLSSQDCDWQRELAHRLRLPYPLLSDSDFLFANALRLPSFYAGGVRYLARLTLILENGQLRKVFYPVHPPPQHAEEVLAWLRKMLTS